VVNERRCVHGPLPVRATWRWERASIKGHGAQETRRRAEDTAHRTGLGAYGYEYNNYIYVPSYRTCNVRNGTQSYGEDNNFRTTRAPFRNSQRSGRLLSCKPFMHFLSYVRTRFEFYHLGRGLPRSCQRNVLLYKNVLANTRTVRAPSREFVATVVAL